jgi:hypothetical protein
MFIKKGRGGGTVGVYMEPRGRWTEEVWEPLVYKYLTAAVRKEQIKNVKEST